ncbi:MAG: sugar transferase [Candidatus Niyogibacteria bacterium]|nr:sugar transferase [Candidatus Niyogibacteria bacterium]
MSNYKREAVILFVGDLALWVFVLLVTLIVRFGEVPTQAFWIQHLWAFVPLWAAWAIVFFIAGLYGKHTLVFKSKLLSLLLYAQLANSIIAVFFFYFVRYFLIAPKTVLFLYFVISSALIIGWRVYGVPRLGFRKRQKAVLVGSGPDVEELWNEVNGNPRYALYFVAHMDPNALPPDAVATQLGRRIREDKAAVVVADLRHQKLETLAPHFYHLILSGVRFLDLHALYEDIFDRVPVSLLRDRWFVENISPAAHQVYDFLKRCMDVALSVAVGIPSLVLYPLVYCAIKWDDGGPVFIVQERIGRGGKIVRIPKFRTMKVNDGGRWLTKDDRRMTRAGLILRKLRVDEFPQLWSVLRGDLALIGPRPDIRDLGEKLRTEIPHYAVRNIIQPGLSGWAQIRQDLPPQSIEATKVRFSYDLYYIKNRSFALDLEIALKTIKTLLSRSGM